LIRTRVNRRARLSLRDSGVGLPVQIAVTIGLDDDTNAEVAYGKALRYTPGGLPGAAAATGVATSTANPTRPEGPAGRVWILRDGLPVQIAVTIGLDDDTNAEVAYGNLTPGDRVIVSEQKGSSTPGVSQAAPRFFRI